MLSGKLLLPVCLFILASPVWAQKKSALEPAELEAKLLTAVTVGKGDAVEAVGAAITQLSEEQRRGLKFRVRPGEVEFRFGGFCPSHETVEFLLSNRIRDYESLLVLDEAELERAAKVWKAATRAKATQPPFVQFKLLWMEKDKARCEDLEDAFRKVAPRQRKELFYPRLRWEDDGLRIPNIALDRAAVPQTAQAAQVLVILRPAFLNK